MASDHPTHATDAGASTLRRLLLLLVLAGELGLIAELLLLEHMESAWQWAPLALLGLAVPITLAALVRGSAGAVALLRLFGGLMVAAGLAGLYLHYAGNVEFELESEPTLRGWALFVRSMHGATPALAPGSLAQLGLAALLATFRHPSASRRGDPGARSETTQPGEGE